MYIFTMVDRWSRWPEAVPLADISAASCANALIRGWIARFGIPTNLTSDRGAQFTSSLWSELSKVLEVKHINTTAYHPNRGAVELDGTPAVRLTRDSDSSKVGCEILPS